MIKCPQCDMKYEVIFAICAWAVPPLFCPFCGEEWDRAEYDAAVEQSRQ